MKSRLSLTRESSVSVIQMLRLQVYKAIPDFIQLRKEGKKH